MREMICGALMTAIAAASGAAQDVNSANFMLPYCKLTRDEAFTNTTNAMVSGRCLGIIASVAQVLSTFQEAQQKGLVQLDPIFCTAIPQGVSNQQLNDVVLRFGEAHPELTQRDFIAFAMVAMHDAWPCKK